MSATQPARPARTAFLLSWVSAPAHHQGTNTPSWFATLLGLSPSPLSVLVSLYGSGFPKRLDLGVVVVQLAQDFVAVLAALRRRRANRGRRSFQVDAVSDEGEPPQDGMLYGTRNGQRADL